MTDTDKEFFDKRWEMLETDGWRTLVEDLQAMYDSLNTVYAVEDEKSLNYVKGQLAILNMIITLEDQTKLAQSQTD